MIAQREIYITRFLNPFQEKFPANKEFNCVHNIMKYAFLYWYLSSTRGRVLNCPDFTHAMCQGIGRFEQRERDREIEHKQHSLIKFAVLYQPVLWCP